MRPSRPVLRYDLVAEFADAGAEIAQEIIVAAAADLDAAGIAAERAAHRKRQLAVDNGVDRFGVGDAALARRQQRVADLRSHRHLAERRRERAAGAPKTHRDRRALSRF